MKVPKHIIRQCLESNMTLSLEHLEYTVNEICHGIDNPNDMEDKFDLLHLMHTRHTVGLDLVAFCGGSVNVFGHMILFKFEEIYFQNGITITLRDN